MMQSETYTNILALLFATIIAFLFIHKNYKKYALLSTLNEILMFRKMLFNKKAVGYEAGKKIVVSHFWLICFPLILVILMGIEVAGSESGYQRGYALCQSDLHTAFELTLGFDGGEDDLYEPYELDELMDALIDELIESSGPYGSILWKKLLKDNNPDFTIDIGEQISAITAGIVTVLIVRLIYELIVIPIAINNKQKQMPQQSIYAQQANQPPLNTSYTQANDEVAQNQNVTYTQQATQPEQMPTEPETQFIFCSQCGTRYNAAEVNCPNCGMK